MASSRASPVASRSARRQIVRATCSWAAPSDPPGSRKLASGPTTSLSSSISRSSFSMWRVSTVGTGWRAWLVGRRRQVGPEVEQLVLDERQLRGQALAQPGRQRDPDLRVELVDGAVGRRRAGSPWARAGRHRARSGPRPRSGCRSSSGAASNHRPTRATASWHAPVTSGSEPGHLPHHAQPATIRRSYKRKTSHHHVVFGGTSAARAGTEAGDHHRVCHHGR